LSGNSNSIDFTGNNTNLTSGINVQGNGNVFVGGNCFETGYSIIKYSGAGTPLWRQSYDGEVRALAVDGRGNLIVTGYYDQKPMRAEKAIFIIAAILAFGWLIYAIKAAWFSVSEEEVIAELKKGSVETGTVQ
jgi:hypothetical protein